MSKNTEALDRAKIAIWHGWPLDWIKASEQ